jgi:hypothetical protein
VGAAFVERAHRRPGVGAALVLGTCLIASSCGGSASRSPSLTDRRQVAQRFAEAIFHGKADVAVTLLADPGDAVLAKMTTRAAAQWKSRHAAVRLPGTHSGSGWVFRYSGTHPHADGRFEQVRGDFVVVVRASSDGAGVELFLFRNREVRFRTHHDALLSPSSR